MINCRCCDNYFCDTKWCKMFEEYIINPSIGECFYYITPEKALDDMMEKWESKDI